MKSIRGEQVGSAAALMVFCVFAMLAFSVIMLGAVAYKNIAGASRDGADERVCLSYIWTMVKNKDEAEGIYVDEFHGAPVLVIEERLNDNVYQTLIYHHGGWVCELFTQAGYDLPLDSGARIIEIDELRFERIDDRNILVSSGEQSLFIAPRASTGG